MNCNNNKNDNIIIFHIEDIISRKPIYTLFIENDKTIEELRERILYDLDYEDDIILHFDNKNIFFTVD